ncbi:MAG TPA: alpha/beta hydrolase [Candidatus Bathyarchaeia archaeon]|nr:alpha/beta hydrolase [Candidatus Bathyarchaeia archaeon]
MRKMKGTLSSVVLSIVILALSATTALAAPRLPSGPTYKDVTIATVDDAGKPFPLNTNIYLPEKAAPGPMPLLLFIHGNGGAYNFANGSRSYELAIALAERGIAVATIDYRPVTGLPENVHDVKGYVRYFRAHAKEYNIDPERIGVWGTSRGGHLAAMLATTGDMEEVEGDIGGNADQSSRIQAAVIYYPFTDIFLSNPEGTLKSFFGAKDSEVEGILEANKKNETSSPYWDYVKNARLVNPVNHVSKDDPPVLITIGGNDVVTPIEHSTALFNKYLEIGAVASLYAYTLGVHGQVGTDIEAASADWIANKLLVELAPKK